MQLTAAAAVPSTFGMFSSKRVLPEAPVASLVAFSDSGMVEWLGTEEARSETTEATVVGVEKGRRELAVTEDRIALDRR